MILNKPISFELQQLLKDKSDEFDVISTLDYPTIARVLDWLYDEYSIVIGIIPWTSRLGDKTYRAVFWEDFKSLQNGDIEEKTLEKTYGKAIEHCLIKLIENETKSKN